MLKKKKKRKSFRSLLKCKQDLTVALHTLKNGTVQTLSLFYAKIKYEILLKKID